MIRDTTRESEIMQAWAGPDPESMASIGKRYGISKQRVHQIVRQALTRPLLQPRAPHEVTDHHNMTGVMQPDDLQVILDTQTILGGRVVAVRMKPKQEKQR